MLYFPTQIRTEPMVCPLGKTHPGHLVLMFVQPLLAVATNDAVI